VLAARLEPVDGGAQVADRLVELVDEGLDPRRGLVIAPDHGGDPLEPHPRREQALDDGVVQVARDALAVLEEAELAGGSAQLLLGVDARRHVPHRSDRVDVVVRAQGAEAHLDGELGAVGS